MLRIIYNLRVLNNPVSCMLSCNTLHIATQKTPVGSFEWTFFLFSTYCRDFSAGESQVRGSAAVLPQISHLELDIFQRKGRFPVISKYSVTKGCKYIEYLADCVTLIIIHS